MPDKDNLGAVLQPTAFRWQNERDGLQQDDAVAALRASAGSSGFHEMNHPVIAQPVAFTFDPGQSSNPKATHQFCKEHTAPLIKERVLAVAIGTDCYNGAITGNVAATMGTPGSSVNASGPTVMQAVAFPWQSALDPIGKPDDVCGTLIKNQVMGVAHSLRADGFDASEDGTGRGTPLVPVAPSLTATNDPSRSPQSSEVTQQVAAVHASTMTVRRLTPVECERLQGFPDNWTAIPWRKKPAEECPDGPRYKALGNSMACNCMAWIGERIAAYEQRGRVDPTPAAVSRLTGGGGDSNKGGCHA
jgi:hypothetical protein